MHDTEGFFFVSGVGHHSWVCLSIALSENRTDKGQRHGFFNQGSKERTQRSRRNISDAEKLYVEQYSSGGLFGVRLNTNGRQQHEQKQRSAKPLGSERNMEPRFQKSFAATMQLPSSTKHSLKGSN